MGIEAVDLFTAHVVLRLAMAVTTRELDEIQKTYDGFLAANQPKEAARYIRDTARRYEIVQ